MQENENVNPEELQNPKLTTLPVDTEELEIKEKIIEDVEDSLEKEELSEEELKEIYVQQLKDSNKVFKPIKQKGNITTNQFGSTYNQKRKRKNKLTKASRRNNRK